MNNEIKCKTCGDSGDVHTIDGEWRGECTACDAAEILRMRATIDLLTEQLRRWESYREEIADKERRLGGLARNFLDLEAWEDAAKCALKADGMKWVRGRMPQLGAA